MDFYCSITIQTFFLLPVVDLVDFLFIFFLSCNMFQKLFKWKKACAAYTAAYNFNFMGGNGFFVLCQAFYEHAARSPV